ncbi:zinc transporter 6-like isoform X2 [Ornithodoros turicata]|uniref:zinc transporter 6-like isoform X2 n=1 Tax=Ornithodoros turicata TaxID=34597 RepID=UPI0031399A85
MDDIRQRVSQTNSRDELPQGMFRPFKKPSLTPLACVLREFQHVTKDSRAKATLWLAVFNIVCCSLLIYWSRSSRSIAVHALAYLTVFDLACLGNCLLSLWVLQQKANSTFSFGYNRFEVLAIFATTILAQLGSFFIIKESIERIIQQPQVHTGRTIPAAVVAFVCHTVVTYTTNRASLAHVIAASSSSWLQEHVAEVSQSVCRIVPGLSRILLPRLNPLMLLGSAACGVVLLAHFFIEIYQYHTADTSAAVTIALMICITMYPMTIYCAKILLQTAPPHVIGQLDKCLREASTLDGVLEFRHECFWTVSFGVLAGSVHVRVRRDASEQLVLAHIVDRLSNLVSELTVQVFKDEWAWTSSTSFHRPYVPPDSDSSSENPKRQISSSILNMTPNLDLMQQLPLPTSYTIPHANSSGHHGH